VLASPVLVGAVTTLVVIVAVFLAYNANNGLPFVPTREVEVMAANGSNLTPGNDVREGGFRVGTLDSLRPVLLPDGTVGALLKLKLDRTSGPLPVDSQAVIRSRSALGLKYVQIVRGSARRTLPDGGIIPLSQTTVPVQFDEIYKTFDRSTRQSSQQNLVVFGDAFAGRGGALNQTIEQLPVLLGYLESVSRNLNDPRTGLSNFFTQLDRAAQTLAPIVATQVAAFRDAAVTFDAIARDPASFQATIDKSPATLDVGTDSLITTRPFLADLTGFGHDLQAATRQLSPTLPEINLALETAPGPLRRSAALNGQLRSTLSSLRGLAFDPNTSLALRGLTDTVNTLNPQLRYYGPYITVCNWLNMWDTYVPEHFSEYDPTGSSQRALLNFAGASRNSVGNLGATAPVTPSDAIPGQTPQALHAPDFPAAIDNQGNADCENGQLGYPTRLAQDVAPQYQVVTDPHIPGNQGPVYRQPTNPGAGLGPTHVPAGETFTREPQGIPAPPQ